MPSPPLPPTAQLRRASSTPNVEKVIQKKGSRVFDGGTYVIPEEPAEENPQLQVCSRLRRCCRRTARSMYFVAWFLCHCMTGRWRQAFQACGDGYVGHLIIRASENIFYMVDRAFAKQRSQALMMLLVGAVQVGIAGVAYMLVWRYSDWDDDPRPEDDVHPLVEGVWHSWTFMTDPGTHAPALLPDQRVVAALITIGGIVFFASVLGLTVDIIREKMDNLRKGKSKIVEDHQTLILGWSALTMHIIEELCFANESEEGGVICVLALESKEVMEAELKIALPEKKRRGTRVVIRNGSPLLMTDLLRVSAHKAKAIVILAPSGSGPDEADANTVRTVLSLKTVFGNEMQGHIVAEVRDIDNKPLLRTVSDNSVEIVVSHDMIGRLMLMSVRQPGLAKVYEALLGYEGDEFYIQEWPELVGRKFGELQLLFPDAVPIGVYAADDSCLLKPNTERIMRDGDELVVIAEDKHSYSPVDPHIGAPARDPPPRPPIIIGEERVLVCGWRRDIRDILKQLDKIVGYGTEVHMITHCVPIAQREQALHEDGFDSKELKNIIIIHWYGNTSVRRQLDKLPIENYTSCMIFADQAFENDTMYADSHSLATLLLLRDIQAARKMGLSQAKSDSAGSAVERLTQSLQMSGIMESCPVVCEILAPQTQQTIVHSNQLCRLSDFCQTNKLIAQVMAMVSEERAVRVLLDELLGSTGTNIAVVPSTRYVWRDEQICFFEISQRASRLGEILLGWQIRGELQRTVLNPPEKSKLRTWDSVDFAILQGKEVDEERMSMIEESAVLSRAAASAMDYRSTVAAEANSRFSQDTAQKDMSSGAASPPLRASTTRLANSFSQLASVGVIEKELTGTESTSSAMMRNSWAAALSEFSQRELMQMQTDLEAVQEALSIADSHDVYEPDENEQTAVAHQRTGEAMTMSTSLQKVHSLKAGHAGGAVVKTIQVAS